MKKIIIGLLITTVFVGILACQKSATNQTVNTNLQKTNPTPADDAPRISLEDAKKDFDSGKAVFVDSRPNDQYKPEHIKGAINVPFSEAENHWKEIPTDKKIIVYCS